MSEMKVVVPVEKYCIGCKLCEVHCVAAHAKSKSIIRAFKDEKNRPLPRIRVEEDLPTTVAINCRHCVDSPCVTACMSNAMIKDEDGTVRHDAKKCIGCWMCIMVCPFGAISRQKEPKVASKCDMCKGREEGPACVEYCPNDALVLKVRK